MEGFPLDPVALAVALALGWYLKNKTGISNQAIPVLNFTAQFLLRLVGVLGATQVEAGVFGFLGKAGSAVLPFALEALVTTVGSIGVHSGAKATGRASLAVLKKLLLIKGIEVAVKEVEK